MKRTIATVMAAVVFAATPAFVQAAPEGATAPALQVAQANTMVNAEVRKVDKDQGKLTLAHDPIPNLEMPRMTMMFHVKDPAMLDKVKPGDKVRFAADRVEGQLTVTALEPAK